MMANHEKQSMQLVTVGALLMCAMPAVLIVACADRQGAPVVIAKNSSYQAALAACANTVAAKSADVGFRGLNSGFAVENFNAPVCEKVISVGKTAFVLKPALSRYTLTSSARPSTPAAPNQTPAKPTPAVRPLVHVSLRPFIEISNSTLEQRKRAAAYLNQLCAVPIQFLFNRLRMPLDLEFNATPAESAEDAMEGEAKPVLHLAFDQQKALVMQALPSGPAFVLSSPKCGASTMCLRESAVNEPFCQGLAKMAGHWLGLQDPRCVPKSADQGSTRDSDFMLGHDYQPPSDAPPLANARTGSLPYWRHAQISILDHAHVLAPACEKIEEAATAEATARAKRASRE